MKSHSYPYPNLLKLTNICNDAGFDLTPIEEEKGFKVAVWKNDVFVKEGKTVFKDWMTAQKESYLLIFKKMKL